MSNRYSMTTDQPLFYRTLVSQVKQKGRPDELGLLQLWDEALRLFFKLHNDGLISKAQRLEVGIEDRLTLKLNIKAATAIPAASLIRHHIQIPAFKPWVELILRENLRCHIGIKLTPQGKREELYVYTPASHIASILGSRHPFSQQALALSPKGIGVNDAGELGMYFDAREERFIADIEKELKCPIPRDDIWIWEQLRFHNERIQPGKLAFEIKPLSLQLMTRILSHYPFPYFRYLFPKKELRNGNFGKDRVTERYSFYANAT